MTKEREAQQAQTIAEDRKKRDAESWENYLHEQSRSYPEDLLDIDHGAYCNVCSTCGKPFHGFKRRFTCRVCKITNLKVIVDSQAQKIAELQARAPKQYTEAQLRKGFESWVKKNWRAELHKKALKREGAGYYSSTVNDHWTGWINGARYTKSIKGPNA